MLPEYKITSEVNFANLTLTEAVLTLDRNPDTKQIADWLCELDKTRRAVYQMQLTIGSIAR